MGESFINRCGGVFSGEGQEKILLCKGGGGGVAGALH